MLKFSYSQALLALAIALLAGALFKISIEIPTMVEAINKTSLAVDKVSPQIPSILATVDGINSQISAVVNEVEQVRLLVGQQVPDILTQMELTRPVIGNVIEESKQYSAQLPLLITHIEKIEHQVKEIQKLLPEVLTRIDAIVKTTNNSTAEVAKWRPHSEKYLAELEQSRVDIPVYLTRVEDIVIDAKTIGKEASSGLVVGLFKGVVSLPFEVVSGLTGIVDRDSLSAKHLSAQDVAILQEQTIKLLQNSEQNKVVWKNTESGNRGRITKDVEFISNNRPCHKLVIDNYLKNGKKTLNEKLEQTMCMDDKNIWHVI